MSTPLIVNRAPAPRTVGGVEEAIRFSVRDQDAEALRSTLQFFLGYGSAWWGGGTLPEDETRATFTLRSRVGAPSDPALRSLDGDKLLLEKLNVGLQEAMYEFGGLDSPTAFDSPLMFEFELTVDGADVVVDGQSWSGVFAGIKAYNKGVAIKLVDDGVKKIEIHSADPAVAIPTYTAVYDWDQGVPHIFKLLWHPQLDVLRLYVSTGMNAPTADILLVGGAISAFPDLPADEIPTVQPIGFFGHGGFNATSKSRWSSVYFYQTVTRPVTNGISQGGHEGALLSDATVLYDASDLPRKVTRPWVILPDSFGPVGGEEIVTVEGHLIVRRSSLTDSLGFYRVEPKVVVGHTIVDFRLWGNLTDRPPGEGPESGIEVYVDDGAKKAVVEFLDVEGTKSVGLQGGPSTLSGWNGPSQYRLSVSPAGTARVLVLREEDEGFLESELIGQDYATLPLSDLPGPGIGFLHNANSVQAKGELFLSRLQYSLDARVWEALEGLPSAPWALFGTGSPAVENDIVTIEDTNDGGGLNDNLGYSRAETTSEGKGLFLEAICAVDSYTKGGVIDPLRTVTGVGLTIDDDLGQYELMFAEGGPEFGKIALLATNSDLDQNLRDIRAGRAEVAGTYFSVDWARFHHYRIERAVSGDVVVYLDWSHIPVIQFGFQEFEPIASTVEGVRFGSLLSDRKSASRWQSVRYSRSYGWDVETLPKIDDLRYDHAINAIVEVDS